MIEHLPLYTIHEYGTAVEEKFICPSCREDRLIIKVAHTPPEPDELVCPSCSALYSSGWRRHHWGQEAPKVLRGASVNRLGGLFETIQAFAQPPRLQEAINEQPLPHLADFVIDIDRDDLLEAQSAARKIYGFMDSLAPGQVRVYFSGAKGYHLILPWQALGAVPTPTIGHREYRHLAALVARHTGVIPDYKIYSPSRMLRVPDSWHPKSGNYKVELWPDEIEGAVLLSAAPRGVLNQSRPQFSEAANELYEEARDRADASDRFVVTPKLNPELVKGTPPCVAKVLTGGLPYKGSRHATYLFLARYWLSAGQQPEVLGGWSGNKLMGGAIDLGREFAQRADPNTDTPLSVRLRDMDDTIKYVYRNNLRFSCNGPKAVGLCHESCPLRQLESNDAYNRVMLGLPQPTA